MIFAVSYQRVSGFPETRADLSEGTGNFRRSPGKSGTWQFAQKPFDPPNHPKPPQTPNFPENPALPWNPPLNSTEFPWVFPKFPEFPRIRLNSTESQKFPQNQGRRGIHAISQSGKLLREPLEKSPESPFPGKDKRPEGRGVKKLSEFSSSSLEGYKSSQNTCFIVFRCNQRGAEDPWPISADFLNPRLSGLLCRLLTFEQVVRGSVGSRSKQMSTGPWKKS